MDHFEPRVDQEKDPHVDHSNPHVDQSEPHVDCNDPHVDRRDPDEIFFFIVHLLLEHNPLSENNNATMPSFVPYQPGPSTSVSSGSVHYLLMPNS